MIKKIALLLILLIKLIETTKYSDFCYRTRIKNKIKECQENNKYKFNCGKDLCSIDQYSCKSLAVFSMVTKHQKNEFYYFKNSEKKHLYFKKKLELFMRSIKDCPKPQDYKWSSNDVCMKTENCFKAYGYGIWSILMKPDECKCMGKYKYKCNSNLCALNKKACDHLKHKNDFVVKKC
jgi:hypothetical protein